jgi:hypothetical protein
MVMEVLQIKILAMFSDEDKEYFLPAKSFFS